jgi:hypothetical protein
MRSGDAKVPHVRTTVTIDDSLYRDVKAMAAASGRTVGSLVEEALRAALLRAEPVAEPTSPMPRASGAPLAGIDLDDSAALLEVMDAR